jgi:hypothetical protein
MFEQTKKAGAMLTYGLGAKLSNRINVQILLLPMHESIHRVAAVFAATTVMHFGF